MAKEKPKDKCRDRSRTINDITKPTQAEIKALLAVADGKRERKLRAEAMLDQKALDDAKHDKHLLAIIGVSYRHLSMRGKRYLRQKLMEKNND